MRSRELQKQLLVWLKLCLWHQVVPAFGLVLLGIHCLRHSCACLWFGIAGYSLPFTILSPCCSYIGCLSQPSSTLSRMPKEERIKVLSEVSVTTLTSALSSYFQEVKSRNLWQKLKPHFCMKWKGAPQAAVLADVAPLFEKLVTLGKASNCVLPNKNLSTTLVHMHASLELELPPGVDALWSDRLNQCIRSLATHWRSLATKPLARETCYRKATPEQVLLLEKTLKHIKIPEKPKPAKTFVSENVVGKASEESHEENEASQPNLALPASSEQVESLEPTLHHPEPSSNVCFPEVLERVEPSLGGFCSVL